MCGIVGMIGEESCSEILLDGLRRLEYRGYDSAGIATINQGSFDIVRSAGKLVRLAETMRDNRPQGFVGIGHTRWATHGRPSEANAHPHRFQDCVVVHNGIIENYAELKERLISEGHQFGSETDSEIIAHLVYQRYEETADLLKAVSGALGLLEGSFAIAVLHLKQPDAIVVARRMSPLVVGLGDDANYVASDVPAVLSHTRRFVFLDDDEIAVLRKDRVDFHSLAGLKPIVKEPRNISWTPAMAEKGGYKHFMLKEIHEQPRSVSDTLRPRLDMSRSDVVLEELDELAGEFHKWEGVTIVACGTSYHAGLVGKYLIEQLARMPCDVDVASEFRYRNPLVSDRQLVICISQSGETADTIAAVKEAQGKGARIVAICNVVGSTLPRMADATIYTYAGPEIGVASTKAFTSQMAVLSLLALWLGRRAGKVDEETGARLLHDLAGLPLLMEKALADAPKIMAAAQKYLRISSMLYLGRGLAYPIALEGALKLKELSYIHAEGYPAGEMKHGPIALVDDEVPSLFVIPSGDRFDKTMSNIEEIRSRSGPVIAVATKGAPRVADLADDVFYVPDCSPELHPFLTVLPLQLFSYYVADQKGTDVDQPRNLAKSVTVE